MSCTYLSNCYFGINTDVCELFENTSTSERISKTLPGESSLPRKLNLRISPVSYNLNDKNFVFFNCSLKH